MPSTAELTPALPAPDPEPRSPDRLLGKNAWEQVVRDEGVRFARYRHPTAVVVAEMVTRGGPEEAVQVGGSNEATEPAHGGVGEGGRDLTDFAAIRLFGPTAETMLRLARASDRAGGLGPGRFGVLLFEAGEEGAKAYVRRVRDACDDWLRAAPIQVVLSMGWATPGPGEQLRDAIRAADANRTTARPGGSPHRLVVRQREDRRRAVRPA